MRLAVRVAVLDLDSWRGAAQAQGFTLSAMIRHAVDLYIKKPHVGEDLTDLKRSAIIRLFAIGKVKIDSAWLKETTRCNKTIVLRLPRTELQRWKIAAARDVRTLGFSSYEGRPVSAMVRRAVRRYVDGVVKISKFMGQLYVEELLAGMMGGPESGEEGDEGTP